MQIDFQHLKPEQSVAVNEIIRAAFVAADPRKSVQRAISRKGNNLEICGRVLNLEKYDRVFLLGMGKAVGQMSAGVFDKLGDVICAGMIVSKQTIPDTKFPNKIKILYGDHPIPSTHSIESARELMEFVAKTDENDLIISVISGGGSALAAYPVDGINLADIQVLTRILLGCGAKIQEINTIRKHIDLIKGGGLAIAAGSTPMETLIISDVLGDDISMIASGPTSGDTTTFEDAWNIFQKYSIEKEIPLSIKIAIKRGMAGEIQETLKPGDPILTSKQNHVIANLIGSIHSARSMADQVGLQTQVLSTHLVGEAREIGRLFGSYLKSMAETDLTLKRPALIIAGGESTVTLSGKGKGGRNQEIAFGAIEEIAGCKDCVLIALATDGEDGPTDAAGAYITGDTFKRAIDAGLDLKKYGENNDTYTFFDRLDHLVRTGPTGTNVNDILLLFAF